MNTNINPSGLLTKDSIGSPPHMQLRDTRMSPCPLNDFPKNQIAMAYSLRRLRSDYNGYAIDVYRTGDGVTVSIGFDGNDLDITTLKRAIFGSNHGYVTKWYDQSGNGKHLTGNAYSAGIWIVNAGVVYTLYNNRPSIYIVGDNTQYFYLPESVNNRFNCSGLYCVSVSKMIINKTNARIWELTGTINPAENDKIGWSGEGAIALYNVITDLSINHYPNASTTKAGTLFSIGIDILHGGSSPWYAVTYDTVATFNLGGYVSEVIIFNDYKTYTRPSSLLSNIRSYYGTIN